jgi:hypothetical protein
MNMLRVSLTLLSLSIFSSNAMKVDEVAEEPGSMVIEDKKGAEDKKSHALLLLMIKKLEYIADSAKGKGYIPEGEKYISEIFLPTYFTSGNGSLLMTLDACERSVKEGSRILISDGTSGTITVLFKGERIIDAKAPSLDVSNLQYALKRLSNNKEIDEIERLHAQATLQILASAFPKECKQLTKILHSLPEKTTTKS